MRTVNIGINELQNKTLLLGFVGENEHTQIRIDCKKMYDQYPHAAASLTVCPPAGAAYPAVIERDGDLVIWDVTDSDLIHEGTGEIQLSFTESTKIAKTYIGKIKISRSIIPTGAIPDPLDDFLTRAGAALTAIPEEIEESLDEAMGQISADAETLQPGSSATASYDTENKKLTIGVPKGADGADGVDGFSPIATVTKAGKTSTISITDRNGNTTAEVDDGADGKDGADGFSPTASVVKSGKTATIIITDKSGTTAAQVTDGQDGQDGATGATPVISIGTVTTLQPGSDATASMDVTDPEHPVLSFGIPEGEPGNATIDDTSTANNRVWSAQKTNDLKSAIDYNAVYSMGVLIPNTYIVKADGSEGHTSGTDTPWSATHFIPVKPDQRIYVKISRQCDYNKYYDSNKDPISGTVTLYADENVITVPSGAAYIRFSNTTTAMESAIIKLFPETDKTLSLPGYPADAKETTDAINGKVNDTFDYIVGERNLLYGVGVTPGYLINANGEIEENSSYAYTDLIAVDETYYKLYWESKSATSKTVRVHGYDSSDNWLEEITYQNKSTVGKYDFDINCAGVSKIRVSYYKNNASIECVVKKAKINERISTLDSELKDFIVYNAVYSAGVLIPKKYIKLNGDEASDNAWSATDFIPVSPGQMIYVKSDRSSAYNKFYASDKTAIDVELSISEGENWITAPANAAYFRLSNRTVNISNNIIKLFPKTDTNLSTAGMPADAKAVGDGLAGFGTMVVDSYYVDEVNTTVTTIESHSDTPSFVMTLVADPHIGMNSENRITQAKRTFKNIKAVTDRVFSEGLTVLGDFINPDRSYVTTQAIVDASIREIMSYARACNPYVYGIDGNHDGYYVSGDSGDNVPRTENYATMKRVNESYVIRENGLPYFYKDYDRHKLRIIFLATNHQIGNNHYTGMDSAQLTWFSATLASVPSGYDVCIFSHIAPFDMPDFRQNRTEVISALNTWIADTSHTGKCIGWYSGHEHLDLNIPKANNELNCPQVILQCAMFDRYEPTASDTYIYDLPWVANARTHGTVSEDCWTTMVYNREDNKVYLVRFGAGNDIEVDLSDYD